MRPAPIPQSDTTQLDGDHLVADPLVHQTDQLWKETARKNREIFTEIFHPVPTNLVQNTEAYDVCLSLCLSPVINEIVVTLLALYSKGASWSCC